MRGGGSQNRRCTYLAWQSLLLERVANKQTALGVLLIFSVPTCGKHASFEEHVLLLSFYPPRLWVLYSPTTHETRRCSVFGEISHVVCILIRLRRGSSNRCSRSKTGLSDDGGSAASNGGGGLASCGASFLLLLARLVSLRLRRRLRFWLRARLLSSLLVLQRQER